MSRGSGSVRRGGVLLENVQRRSNIMGVILFPAPTLIIRAQPPIFHPEGMGKKIFQPVNYGFNDWFFATKMFIYSVRA